MNQFNQFSDERYEGEPETQWPLNQLFATSWPSESRKVVQCILFSSSIFFSLLSNIRYSCNCRWKGYKGEVKSVSRILWQRTYFPIKHKAAIPNTPLFNSSVYIEKKSNVPYLTLEKVKCSCGKYSCDKYSCDKYSCDKYWCFWQISEFGSIARQLLSASNIWSQRSNIWTSWARGREQRSG